MTILVTGAGRGIGAGLMAAYRERGETVLGTSRAGTSDFVLDVTSPESHSAMAHALAGRAIDLLVCNAGLYLDRNSGPDRPVAAEAWAETFATNVTGVYLTIESLLPNLEKAGDARIAIISSQMASTERAPGGSYAYRASKAAVLNLGRNLASDLRARRIAVGIYHPGWVRTDMGGQGAAVAVGDAAQGLIRRFDALTLDRTGCFETWDGQTIPW